HYSLFLYVLFILLASLFFSLNDTATTQTYTLSLHDSLPISDLQSVFMEDWDFAASEDLQGPAYFPALPTNGPHSVQVIQSGEIRDRKSTRLNSSHGSISYAVFCLKKKKTQ